MTVFADDFTGLGAGVLLETRPGWSSLSGAIRGDGAGALVQSSSTVGNYRADTSTGTTDMYARCRARVLHVDSAGNGQVAPTVRVPDSANTGTGYLLQMDATSTPGLVRTKLRVQTDNSRSDLTGTVDHDLPHGDWLTLEIRVEGTSIRGYVNGVLTHETASTVHPDGMRGGLYMFNNGAWEISADDFEQGALTDLDPGGTPVTGTLTDTPPVAIEEATGAATVSGPLADVAPAPLEQATATAAVAVAAADTPPAPTETAAATSRSVAGLADTPPAPVEATTATATATTALAGSPPVPVESMVGSVVDPAVPPSGSLRETAPVPVESAELVAAVDAVFVDLPPLPVDAATVYVGTRTAGALAETAPAPLEGAAAAVGVAVAVLDAPALAVEAIGVHRDVGDLRDIAVTITGPVPHPIAVTGPALRRRTITGPSGHPLTVTAPRS